MDRNQILDAVPLDAYLRGLGKVAEPRNGKVMASCPLHDDKTPSMSIDLGKRLWKCFSCGNGGTVIDLHMRVAGMSVKDAMFDLAEKHHIPVDQTPRKSATYEYRDQVGRPIMAVDRIVAGKKKKFSQWHVGATGERVNGLDGVSRSLYRLEKWHGKEEVCLVEGEKCVHALEEIGMLATTNPGGSGGWLDAYAELLKGKRVEIWPDNDAPGQKWLDAVLSSLRGKVEALRVCRVPDPYNDVADMVEAQGAEMAGERLAVIAEGAGWIQRGIQIALLSADEAYDAYVRRAKLGDTVGVDLGRWLPSLRSRPLMPGDLGLVLGDTGVGKTALLANLAYSQAPMPVLFFELELSPEDMAERFVARDNQVRTYEVEAKARKGERYGVKGWSHVYICPTSTMTVEAMETLIVESELKIGSKPGLVLVDYVGLVQGGSGKRYERMSTIAEDLKRMARNTGTVVFIASQVKRDEDRTEMSLHDAKDSGSLENSAQIVLGAVRTAVDKLTITILKQTRKAGRHTITALYDGDRQTITEMVDVVEMVPTRARAMVAAIDAERAQLERA